MDVKTYWNRLKNVLFLEKKTQTRVVKLVIFPFVDSKFVAGSNEQDTINVNITKCLHAALFWLIGKKNFSSAIHSFDGWPDKNSFGHHFLWFFHCAFDLIGDHSY